MLKSVLNLDAPRDRVYTVLSGFDTYSQWVPGCKKCTILSASGNQTETELVLEGLKTLTVVLRFEGDPGQSLRFEMTKSTDLKAYSGEYRLMEAASGAGTVVISEINMDAGAMVPKFMADRIMRKSLDDMGKALQARIKASMAEAPVVMTPSAIRKGRKRNRRILQISRTPAGTRIWYLGKVYEHKDS
jgi:carbon monoxide dehydrogenase subunit G